MSCDGVVDCNGSVVINDISGAITDDAGALVSLIVAYFQTPPDSVAPTSDVDSFIESFALDRFKLICLGVRKKSIF